MIFNILQNNDLILQNKDNVTDSFSLNKQISYSIMGDNNNNNNYKLPIEIKVTEEVTTTVENNILNETETTVTSSVERPNAIEPEINNNNLIYAETLQNRDQVVIGVTTTTTTTVQTNQAPMYHTETTMTVERPGRSNNN